MILRVRSELAAKQQRLGFIYVILGLLAALVAQTVKNLPAVWETQVRSLGQEVPMQKTVATHSHTLAWKIPWMEEPSRLGRRESDTTERLHFHFLLDYICYLGGGGYFCFCSMHTSLTPK